MKLQKIILCVAVALTAFGASLGLLEIGNYIRTAFEPLKVEIKPPNPIQPTLYYPQRIPDLKQLELTPPEESEPEEETFDDSRNGYYYIVGENPKGFKDFEMIELSTIDYSEKLKKYLPVKPTGLLMMKKHYEFSRVNVTDQRFSFVTQSIKGVSYRFEGKFIEPEEIIIKDKDYGEYTTEVVLKGRLTKWRSGKKIAEAKVKMAYTIGC